jgi:hypothetical protein
VNAQVYSTAFAKRGEVFKFADVSLAPPTEATVQFETNDAAPVTKTIELTATVGEVKAMCEEWFGIPARQVQLYYNDVGMEQGLELLTHNSRSMICVGVKTGDSFVVDRKKPAVWRPKAS